MTIDISPDLEAQIKDRAIAEGLSVASYLERLFHQEELRRTRLIKFREAIEERFTSASNGDSLDGEEVMDRLISELGPEEMSGR